MILAISRRNFFYQAAAVDAPNAFISIIRAYRCIADSYELQQNHRKQSLYKFKLFRLVRIKATGRVPRPSTTAIPPKNTERQGVAPFFFGEAQAEELHEESTGLRNIGHAEVEVINFHR
jgi:hypothetical protein